MRPPSSPEPRPQPQAPIRSAVGGSLIRTLLIQVQKVKVDVALAMDGIEKMLKSQQLTFGFVGVAPSMLVLAVLGRWVRGLTRTDGGRKRRNEGKRRCWMTLRCVKSLSPCDRAVMAPAHARAPSSPSPGSSTSSSRLPAPLSAPLPPPRSPARAPPRPPPPPPPPPTPRPPPSRKATSSCRSQPSALTRTARSSPSATRSSAPRSSTT